MAAPAIAAPPAATPGPAVAAGRRIYLDGVLPSGKPVRGTMQGDVTFTGLQASCGSCHRRSGFGASEAGAVAPPVIGEFLYRPIAVGAEQTGQFLSSLAALEQANDLLVVKPVQGQWCARLHRRAARGLVSVVLVAEGRPSLQPARLR